jgi:hypothetical protein
MFIVSPLTPVAAFLAGISILVLAARRWNENYADAGLGLITLGVLSLFMIGAPDIRGNKAEYFAAVFSRALIGLAFMTGFWHWLTGVWHQQLDGGQTWTTAGRLIHPCRRLGFLLGAIGVLVSCQLAFWPKLPNVHITDNTLGRWIWGMLANLLLIATLIGATRRTGKSTLAWLTLTAVASTVTFIVIRSAGTFIYSGFLEYWPLLLATVSGLMAVLADKAGRSVVWHPFREPLYAMAVLVLPLIAIFGATVLASRAIPPWVAPATFGVLAGCYSLTASWPGPRRFYILTFVCAGAAVWHLLP